MTSNSGNIFSSFLKLSKINIMLPVSLTGFTGYFLFDPGFSAKILLLSAGILLLASAASVLNQIQEVDIDRKMERTLNRPIPSKKVTMKQAIIFFLFTLLSGFALIYFFGNLKAVIIGLITILWYNGVYTYSKRITAFAVVPGAVTGALPILIGWVAAGGGIFDRNIVFLEFLFFIGQIPHFWLLVMKHGEEYTAAGLPSLTDILSIAQISWLTFIWVVLSVLAAMFLCYFEVIHTGTIIAILLVASVFIIWKFSGLLKPGQKNNSFAHYSVLLNSYFLLILILLISDKVLS
jgi:protoheme IX farnesyltransferase